MLLHVQLAVEILHADVMHIEIIGGRHGADAIEEIFRSRCAGYGVHHYVSVGQQACWICRATSP